VPVVDHPYGGSTTGTFASYWVGGLIKEEAKLRRNFLRLAFQATMGHADDAIAARLECRIAGPITLERGSVAMKRVAIRFDHESLLGPERVDLQSEDHDVCGGMWKSVIATERKQAILQR
jgi:hypothetical protein